MVKTTIDAIIIITIGVLGGNSEVEQHLEMGRKFLQEGNLADALNHYNMAVSKFSGLWWFGFNWLIAGDPLNYLTYFKRAAVYLALGQSKRALPDIDKVLELKPDFHQVILES